MSTPAIGLAIDFFHGRKHSALAGPAVSQQYSAGSMRKKRNEPRINAGERG
jgi:hypothetical protein